jgi:hypothetical protein
VEPSRAEPPATTTNGHREPLSGARRALPPASRMKAAEQRLRNVRFHTLTRRPGQVLYISLYGHHDKCSTREHLCAEATVSMKPAFEMRPDWAAARLVPRLPLFGVPSRVNSRAASRRGRVAHTAGPHLHDAIDRGLKANLGLLVSDSTSEAARGQRLQALSALLPQRPCPGSGETWSSST